jgi:5-amino-6-(5-phospho-D-ribitylamino)uracil phosphatase
LKGLRVDWLGRDREAHAAMNYDLLAIDLDGTLLARGDEVSRGNIAAIRKARAAGMRVVVCTGRGYTECRHVARQIEQVEPVAVAGGAIIAEGESGRTIERFAMEQKLVRRLVDSLVGHGHAALVLKDGGATGGELAERGHDYVVVSPKGEAGVDPVSRWWFDMLQIDVRVVRSLDEDEHPEHTVRVGVCGSRRETQAAGRELREDFADQVTLHHFNAVVPGMSLDPDEQIVILEAFDPKVNKWTAMQWLARRFGVDPARVAAIGNDINDIALLSGAGLGIAVENAVPECLAVAQRKTLRNDQDGVAHAIEQMLAGTW